MRKPARGAGFLFMYSAYEIFRNADIKRPAVLASEHINVIGHSPIIGLYGSRLALRLAGMTILFGGKGWRDPANVT
jgi:hypothetical protein